MYICKMLEALRGKRRHRAKRAPPVKTNDKELQIN